MQPLNKQEIHQLAMQEVGNFLEENGYEFFYETHEHEKIMKEGFAQIQREANKKKFDSELFEPSIFE